jgi:hypothetical protein
MDQAGIQGNAPGPQDWQPTSLRALAPQPMVARTNPEKVWNAVLVPDA